jgi:hypothetical protein
VTAMASAASGDASPRDFMSFLLSRKDRPLAVRLYRGLMRSVFRNRSAGMCAVFSQSRMAPHISARLLPYIIWFMALLPKFTPRILYRCSFSRSTMPAPSPPSSMHDQRRLVFLYRFDDVAYHFHRVSAFQPLDGDDVTALPHSDDGSVSAEACRVYTDGDGCAVSSLYLGRAIASSTRLTPMN